MSKKAVLFPVILIFVFTGVVSTFALAEDDVEGSQDHSMISRFEGSVIKDYEQFNYDRQEFVTGMEEGEVEKTAFEGKTTRIRYTAPEECSVLEVHRNYKLALQDAGFEIVYECGDDAKCHKVNDFDTPLGYDNVFGRGSNRNYSLARLAGSEKDVVVGVFTARRHDKTRTLLLIVEEMPMETDKVEVEIDAEDMAEDIDKKGSVSIYGILFDTDKATIKKESESTLAEIAALLEQKPDLRLYIVGHTDDTGSLEYNMNLSRKRAKAVVDYLSSKNGIRQERLIPRGVGPLAPVASNETEEGRARNRRVELVKMPEQ